ncbi:MAG: exodeoxyribonuclease VII large subunit [Agromyces sp.]
MTENESSGEALSTRESPWSVALLSSKIRGWIDRLGTAWVEGEVTQWGVSAGNVYGKLKDLHEDATVSFNVWSSTRAKFESDFAQGDRVVALVKPNWWVKGGSLTMNVLDMRHVGLGDLLEQLERLRKQLASEGLFDADRKQPIPFLPRRIGLITGKDSDAEKDVIKNAKLRWPSVQFELAYAAVQGEKCVPEVLAALAKLDANPDVDVIIIARGGGDFQNLLGFSDERLVRAVAAAHTPVVSAIGHEADRPLLDDVADLRASTPTDAAKRVVPDVADELDRIAGARQLLRSRLTTQLSHELQRLEQVRSRPVLATPQSMIDARAEELTRWVARSSDVVNAIVERASAKTAELRAHLRGLSPQSTLDRGFAIVQTADGTLVRTPADAPAEILLTITVAGGRLGAKSSGETD